MPCVAWATVFHIFVIILFPYAINDDVMDSEDGGTEETLTLA